MGVGSVLGAVLGGLLVGVVPGATLKVGLGVILIVSAAKTFQRVRAHPATTAVPQGS